jgi:RHS repeat-associated protein
MTDENGVAKVRYDYLPFGQEILPPSSGGRASVLCGTVSCYGQSDAVRQKFTGKERDAETGLDYFLARYDSSAQGRFTSPDIKMPDLKHLVNPQKWNRYTYTLNNPFRYVDPDGQVEIEFQLNALIQAKARGGYGGDNRGFGEKGTSRTSVSIRVETDPAKSGTDPRLSWERHAGESRDLDTGRIDTQTKGLPLAGAYRDSHGNTVINFWQDAGNPLEPNAPHIRSDLTVTVPQNGSSMMINGSISMTPSFELNVTMEGGTTKTLPLQTEPEALSFPAGLFFDRKIFGIVPLPPAPPPPPPPCQQGGNNNPPNCVQ